MPSEALTHLKAIVFCRCTKDNIDLLKRELSGSPKFAQINVYFSNRVQPSLLSDLAAGDTGNQINQVQEVYLDYQAINSQLFSLDIPNVVKLSCKTSSDWTRDDDVKFARMADGLHAALMSLRAHSPAIRYDEGSELCAKLAQELDQRLQGATAASAKPTTVLILDRREDPVTPLLN